MINLEAKNVLLMPKDGSWVMRLLGVFLGSRFMTQFWTTYRLPFCRPVIAYPSCVEHPEFHTGTILHELVHVEQFRPWYGPIWVALLCSLFPLPVLFSGRWFVERPAYLQDILSRRYTPNSAADMLWQNYGYPWPRKWMEAWFTKQLVNSRK